MIQALTAWWNMGIPCVFHSLTGAYCPGCGGTRAILYMLHGNMRLSFQYHPLVIYIVFILLVWLGSFLCSKRWKKMSWLVRKYPIYIFLGVGVIFINWGYKNYMLLVKGIDLLP